MSGSLAPRVLKNMCLSNAKLYAKRRIERMSRMSTNEWLQISLEWDLNVWKDDSTGEIHAALYSVKGGITDLSKGRVLQ